MKKILKITLTIGIILTFAIPVYADEVLGTQLDNNIIEDHLENEEFKDDMDSRTINSLFYWDYEIKEKTFVYKGGNLWVLFYQGSPAVRAGEYDTVSYSVSSTHEYIGSICKQLTNSIQLELGYSFGVEETFAISKNSAQLEQGEYIKASYRKVHERSEICQRKIRSWSGWSYTQWGQSYYTSGSEYTGKTITMYAYKAIAPQIKLEYWKNGKLLKNGTISESVVEKIEYYEYVNGEYLLIETKGGVLDEK